MAVCSLSLNIISKVIDKEMLHSRLSMPLSIGKDLYTIPYSFDKEDLKDFNHRGALVFSLKADDPFISITHEKFVKVSENTPFFNMLKKIAFCKVEKIEKIQGERTIIFTLKTDENCFDYLTEGYKLVFNIMPYKANALLLSLDNKILALFHEKIDIEKDIYLTRNATYIKPKDRQFPISNDIEEYSTFICKATYRNCVEYLSLNKDVDVKDFMNKLYSSNSIYLIKNDILPFSFNKEEAKEIKVEEIYSLFISDQKKQAKFEKEKQLINTIEKSLNLAKRKKSKLLKDLQDNKNSLIFMEYGQLLMLYQTEIKKGDKDFKVDSYTIPLDVKLNPIENANHYFKRYNKSKNAVNILNSLLIKTDEEITYLEKKIIEAKDGTPRDILELKNELTYLNYLKGNNKKVNYNLKKKSYDPHYLKTVYCKIGFGMNGLQNEELTFKIAQKDDTFIHVENYPGSHVVILDYTDLDKAINLAGELALYLSHLNNGTIMIAKKKDVKKNPSKIGLVNILKYKTLVIKEIRDESISLFKEVLN